MSAKSSPVTATAVPSELAGALLALAWLHVESACVSFTAGGGVDVCHRYEPEPELERLLHQHRRLFAGLLGWAAPTYKSTLQWGIAFPSAFAVGAN